MSKFAKGDIAYVKISSGWVQVKIIRAGNKYYTVKRLDRPTAFGAAEHRLLTPEEFSKLEFKPPEPRFRPPPLH